MSLKFEWDTDKAASNQKKHGVTFEEARTVFADPLAAIFDDEAHSQDEPRELIIGHSDADRCCSSVSLSVGQPAVRIISARRATKKERRDYEENQD